VKGKRNCVLPVSALNNTPPELVSSSIPEIKLVSSPIRDLAPLLRPQCYSASKHKTSTAVQGHPFHCLNVTRENKSACKNKTDHKHVLASLFSFPISNAEETRKLSKDGQNLEMFYTVHVFSTMIGYFQCWSVNKKAGNDAGIHHEEHITGQSSVFIPKNFHAVMPSDNLLAFNTATD
jgi:hypothetical protein